MTQYEVNIYISLQNKIKKVDIFRYSDQFYGSFFSLVIKNIKACLRLIFQLYYSYMIVRTLLYKYLGFNGNRFSIAVYPIIYLIYVYRRLYLRFLFGGIIIKVFYTVHEKLSERE